MALLGVHQKETCSKKEPDKQTTRNYWKKMKLKKKPLLEFQIKRKRNQAPVL